MKATLIQNIYICSINLKKDGTITEDYTYPKVTGYSAMSIGTYQYKDNQIIANFEKSSNPETPYYTAIYERK